MQVQPYLFFNARCEEALAFYTEALGAEVTMQMRYAESPEPCPEGFQHKIMHASMRVGEAVVMASDGNSTEPARCKYPWARPFTPLASAWWRTSSAYPGWPW